MPTSIESFVKTLESEGVDAGRNAARKIEAEAKEQAEKIISGAREKAEQIVAGAQAEAEKLRARMDSSLELAARDAILLLRDRLSRQLEILLKSNVEQVLNDDRTLVAILREAIPTCAKADTGRTLRTQVNLSQGMQSPLLAAALQELATSLKSRNVLMEVGPNLAKGGFEYKVDGSTIEVSTDSVTSLLMEMIDPDLQRFLVTVADPGDQSDVSK